MSKRKRRLTEKALNSPFYNHSEPSAHEIVIDQLATLHNPAYQKLTSIHVPEETSSINQNCSFDKVVPQRQSSKGALQTPATAQKRIDMEFPSLSQSGSCSLTENSEVIAVPSHSEVIPQQASSCTQLKQRPCSRKRKKSQITDDTSNHEVIPQPVPRGSRGKPQPRSRQRKTKKQTDDTSDYEVIPQPVPCSQFKPQPRSRQRKKSKITDDTSDNEVIPQPASRCQGQSRRNNIQKGKLGSGKFERYLESIWKRHPEDRKNSFTYLDSLWFSLYTNDSSKAKVLNWITKKKIFSKTYVFVPIVMWSHWNLLIFCHLGESLQSIARTPCMLLLDSLRMENPLEPKIRKFVLDIFDAEQRPETKDQIMKIPLLVPKVPQQRNDGDCGNFVLYYINLFLQSAPENFSISEGYPYFMKEDWFTPERVESFCEELESTTESTESMFGSDECFSDNGDVVVCLDHNQQCQ